MSNELFTFQTRLEVTQEQELILQQYACLMSLVERSLFAMSAKGHLTTSCKNPFLKQFNITARQFNACRSSLDGKMKACQAGQKGSIERLKAQLASLDNHKPIL